MKLTEVRGHSDREQTDGDVVGAVSGRGRGRRGCNAAGGDVILSCNRHQELYVMLLFMKISIRYIPSPSSRSLCPPSPPPPPLRPCHPPTPYSNMPRSKVRVKLLKEQSGVCRIGCVFESLLCFQFETELTSVILQIHTDKLIINAQTRVLNINMST